MKFYILSFAFIVMGHFTGFTQNNPPAIKLRSFGMPGKTTMVLDSAGKTLTYDDWHSKIITGEYSLIGRQASHDDTAFYLKRLPEAEIARRIANMPPPPEGPFKNDEKSFTPFSVKDINGFELKPEEWVGKLVVLNFWFIKCSPCKAEIPELNKIVAKYANNKNVIFIGICLDGKRDIQQFINEMPFAYYQVPDGRELTAALGITNYPLNVVIDKQGITRFNATGYGPHWAKFIDEAIGKYKDL